MNKQSIIISLAIFLSFLVTNIKSKDINFDVFNCTFFNQTEYKGPMYSGYLATNRDNEALYYLFVPSQDTETPASEQPFLLWLNGGPGCSSLFGMAAEIGPVISKQYSGNWTLNEYSWNKNAHLLFIEAPSVIGFSIGDRNPENVFDDNITAAGTAHALSEFFQKDEFKQYKDCEFFISGESYAGVYIPFLAMELINNYTDKVNLKGILIGNGLTSYLTDAEESMIDFSFWHGIVPIELYRRFEDNCPHLPPESNSAKHARSVGDQFGERNVTHECNLIREEVKAAWQGLDIYGIYRPCPPESPTGTSKNHLSQKKVFLDYLKKANKKYRAKNYRPTHNKKESNEDLEPEIDMWPDICPDDLTMNKLFNDKDLRKGSGVQVDDEWVQCNFVNYTDSEPFDIFYQQFMPKHPELRVWVFSGEADGCLSTIGTKRWIDMLHLNVKDQHRPFHSRGQVSGFVERYENGLTIVTLIGAGHMVPQDRGEDAKTMVDAFFKGDLPD